MSHEFSGKVVMSSTELETIQEYKNSCEDVGWVYVLYDGYSGVTKIGSTKTVNLDRVNTQIAGASTKICFIGAFMTTNYRELEIQVHHLFKEVRFNGEWFRIKPDVVLDEISGIIEDKCVLTFFNHLPTILKYNMMVQEDNV